MSWLGEGDTALHKQTLGRMAATQRLVRGETFHDRAIRAGLTTGQLRMAEQGMIGSMDVAEKLIKVCGYHRDLFSRRFLGPVLERQARCAETSCRNAQRDTLRERVPA